MLRRAHRSLTGAGLVPNKIFWPKPEAGNTPPAVYSTASGMDVGQIAEALRNDPDWKRKGRMAREAILRDVAERGQDYLPKGYGNFEPVYGPTVMSPYAGGVVYQTLRKKQMQFRLWTRHFNRKMLRDYDVDACAFTEVPEWSSNPYKNTWHDQVDCNWYKGPQQKFQDDFMRLVLWPMWFWFAMMGGVWISSDFHDTVWSYWKWNGDDSALNWD